MKLLIFCFFLLTSSFCLNAQHWQESFAKAQSALENNNLTEAETLGLEALKVAHERHGEVSNESINTLQLLAQLFILQENFDLSLKYSKELVNTLSAAVGKENQYYVQAVLALGDLLFQTERFDEVFNLYNAEQAVVEAFISSDEEYGYFLADLAFLLNYKNEPDKAIAAYKKAFHLFELINVDKEFNLELLSTLNELLVAHGSEKDVVYYGKKLITSHPDVRTVASAAVDVGNAYQKSNAYDSAEIFYIQAKNVYQENNLEEDEEYSFLINQLAYISSSEGDNQESNKYISENSAGSTDKISLFNYAIMAQNNGKLKDAEKYYEQLFALNDEQKLNTTDQIILYDYFSLFNIRVNNYEQASTFISKGLNLGESEYGAGSIKYLNLLSHQALIDNSFGRYSEAKKRYEDIIEKIKGQNLQSTSLYVDVLSNYAKSLQHLNEFLSAKFYFKEAVAIAETIDFPKDNLAILYNNYAVILQQAGDYHAAENVQRDALKLLSETYGRDHSNFAFNVINLGEIYIKQGDFSQADSVLQEAKVLISRIFGTNSPQYAMAVISAAKVDQESGRYAQADKAYIEALQVLQNSGPENQIDLAYGLNDYALLLKQLGNYKLAERNFKSASEIFKQLLGENNADYISTLSNLANLYQMQDRDAEAEDYLKRVMLLDQQMYGDLHPKLAQTYHNLASFYQKKDKLDEAIDLYKKALQIDSVVHGTSHHSYANTLYNLANLYDAKEDFQAALTAYKRVLTVMEQVYGKNNPEYTYRLYGLARLHQRLRNNDKALELYRQISEAYLHQIREYFPALSEDQKSLFYAKVNPVFNSYRELLINSKDKTGIAGELFNLQLNTKAILLKASNRLRNEISSNNDPAVRMLYDKLITNKNRLINYYNYSKENLEKEGIDLYRLENEVNLLEKELSEQLDIFSEVYEPGNITWQKVKAALSEDEILVEIVRVQEIMSNNKISYAALILAKEYNEPKIVLFDNGSQMEGKAYNFYRNALKFMIRDTASYAAFWQPVDEHVNSFKNIYISPDGIYNKLSINTIFNSSKGKYLIDDHLIRFISSPKDLQKKNVHIESAKPVATLFGYPVFNPSQSTEPVDAISGTRLYEPWMTNVDLLPGTKVEVDNIEEAFKQNSWSVQKNIELDATEEVIKKVKGSSVLHIATHGYFSEDITYQVDDWKEQDKTEEYDFNPLLRSGLLLTKAESTVRERLLGKAVNTNNDGILTAYEAMNLNLSDTELVVLSACETGLGEVRNGEGVYGLQRAFHVAGARNLIMSLWKVDDKATQELMSRFYEVWLESDNLHYSFRKAQLELKDKYEDPALWGGFIINGI